MPWAVAAAAVAAGGAIYSGNKAEKAAGAAARSSTVTANQEARRMEEATDTAQLGLQPYADQEAMARNQMMGQLGLVGGGGGAVAGPGSGQQMGAGYVPLGGPPGSAGQAATARDEFLKALIQDEMAIYARAGYGSVKDPTNLFLGTAEGVETELNRLVESGAIPAEWAADRNEINRFADDTWVEYGSSINGLQSSPLAGGKTYGTHEGGWSTKNVQELASKFYDKATGTQMINGEPIPDQFAGGTQGFNEMGGTTFDENGNPIGGGGGGGIETVQSIMQRAGVQGAPQGFEDQFYEDVSNPNFAMGMGYESNPAYQKMIEETSNNVNQYAANAGGLYSGRRGEALREASAATQMNFQRDLADRQAQDLVRRGDVMGADRSRADQYYVNYMNMLQNLATPTTATNIANLETGNAANISNLNTAATSDANALKLQGTQAAGAGYADAAGAIAAGASHFAKK